VTRSILGLFGKSPFGPLQNHARKVAQCVGEVRPLIDALFAGDRTEMRLRTEEINRLEHQADILKNGIRDDLPNTLFLPVDRRDLLELLAAQDAIADVAEDLALLVALKDLEVPEAFREGLMDLLGKALAAVEESFTVVAKLDEAVEAAYSGPEAETVLERIDEVARLEHETDEAALDFLRVILAHDTVLSTGDFWLWTRIARTISQLANAAERVSKRTRLTLAR
jgi:predicted phosphate transport protein (TIGR00153 family)